MIFPNRAIVLGGLLFGLAACGSVTGTRPDAGGAGADARGDAGGSGGVAGAGAGTGGRGGAGGSDGGVLGTGGASLGTGGGGGAAGSGGAPGGIVLRGGISTLSLPAAPTGAIRLSKARISAPGPMICNASTCLVSGGIVP